MNTAKQGNYVLISPVRDEATYIRKTLESVVAQTVRPLMWVIVSDGSTDGTDEIVNEFASRYDWIVLVRMPERDERHFGGKVNAFNAGLARVGNLAYNVIGNVDGDVSFEPDYIEYLLGKFAQNPRLGVAGTNYVEDSWDPLLKQDYRFSSIEDVTGQCQLFRRECFESFGGYKPSRHGGIDLAATLSARMHGWETRVFTDKVLVHRRQQGTAEFKPYMVEFYNGQKDYRFGSHVLWEICRVAYRLTRKPVILGGVLLFFGYFSAMLTGAAKVFPADVIEFRRKEQLHRLKNICRSFFSLRSPVDQGTSCH
jgi:glycosyltransferase involved in cell wall biosynthesis